MAKKKKTYAKDDPDKPLTAKQRAFVEAYAGNATEAALAAGYTTSNARIVGCQNLTKANVKKAIENRGKEARNLRIATRQERQNFWTRVMLGEEPDADMKDRLKATELLGRSEADFTEKIQADMKVNVTRKEYKKSK